ncbi:YkvA family protein [Tellurirhabdus rosea]|uniref:YkvA family protein n=1 Tax=Tellurirhabdus rosea TaxID=2674997 RepID=UPI0022565A9F|nr:YkvA family protein [Tellurirhabdus rosea]
MASKSSSLGVSGSYAAVKDQINVLVRMLRAYAKGDYKAVPQKTLISAAAVLIYFVSPIDLIVDFLPVIGFADDVALILWLVRSISVDLDKFRQWEDGQKTIKIG